MENKYHLDPNDSYYKFYKPWMIPFIPDSPSRILDLGCGSGELGKRLRELNKPVELIGVEIYAPAADEALKYYNKVYKGDVEEMDLHYDEYFDFIVCGDILEHLRDPWSMLQRIKTYMKKDGLLLASIPNIRYWTVLKDLIFKGQFEYVEGGVLDITHLRFFTRRSFKKILSNLDYEIVDSWMKVSGVKKNAINKLTFNVFEEYLGAQYCLIAKKVK